MTIADMMEKMPMLRRFALSLCGDSFLCDDLVQQAMVRALEHQARIEKMPEGQGEAYLVKTVKNLYIDHLRRNRRESLPGELPEPGMEADFSGLHVREMLELLPDNLREVVRLRHIEGYHSGEIAERMGIPPATVRTRLRAAMLMMRKREESK